MSGVSFGLELDVPEHVHPRQNITCDCNLRFCLVSVFQAQASDSHLMAMYMQAMQGGGDDVSNASAPAGGSGSGDIEFQEVCLCVRAWIDAM